MPKKLIDSALEKVNDISEIPDTVLLEKTNEKTRGTRYFKWQIQDSSILATAREENPYAHYCPIDHFNSMLSNIIHCFKNQNIMNNYSVFELLVNKELSQNRPFKGKAEEYKIRMALGILEIEKIIKWTGRFDL